MRPYVLPLALSLLTSPVAGQSRLHQYAAADSGRVLIGVRPTVSADDTLPQRVVARLLGAFNRHDARGVAAEYDSAIVQWNLADSSGTAVRGTRAGIEAGVAHDFPQIPDLRAKLLRRTITGPFVSDVYVVSERGRRRRQLDLFEVRHGKIVREWIYEDN